MAIFGIKFHNLEWVPWNYNGRENPGKSLISSKLPWKILEFPWYKSWNIEKNDLENPGKPWNLSFYFGWQPCDSDAILNFCSVDFCFKWTLYFVSTSNFMKEYKFSRLFDFGKLFNMSVKVYIFMKALTMKKFS